MIVRSTVLIASAVTWVVAFAAVAALIVLAFYFYIFRKMPRAESPGEKKSWFGRRRPAPEQPDAGSLEAEVLLSDLDIGIVAYDAAGKRQIANRTAGELLGADAIPEQLETFMSAYCEDNGIMARLLLGKTDATGVVTVGRKTVRLTARENRRDHQRRRSTVFLLQDITKQALQEQKRKEFVANVSHELKTPLTTIVTYSESLMDWGLSEKTEDGIRNDVRRIHDDAMRMQHLVTDLLLLSSIDSRALQMRMESMDLNYLVRLSTDRMQMAAQEKQIQLSCTSVSIVPPVFGDRASLDRIISNLISNAIKYSDVGTEIKVYIGMVHDEAYVKVTDQGFGIDEQHLTKIFDRFFRVDVTGSRIFGGTGLGLAIVKELVDMHGGQISVQSALGRGSTFTVLLPLGKTIHNKVLNTLEQGGRIQSSLHLASLNELLGMARDAGMAVQTAADLTATHIEELRQLLNEAVVSQEDIQIEAEDAGAAGETAQADH